MKTRVGRQALALFGSVNRVYLGLEIDSRDPLEVVDGVCLITTQTTVFSDRLKGKVMSTCVTPACLYGTETL